MKPLDVKSFVFDLGGTLYGPTDLVGEIRGFLEELGLTGFTDDAIQRSNDAADAWLDEIMFGTNAHAHWEPSHDEFEQYDRIVLTTLGVADNLDDYVARYQHKWDVRIASLKEQLFEGCKSTLEELHSRGYRLAAASNRWGTPLPYLERDGIADLFESVEYSNVPGYRKPSPYMLVQVASQLHVNPIKMAYVGNVVKYDIVAAQRAGAVPILLAWGNVDEEKLAPSGTTILKKATELLELVGSNGHRKEHRQR